MPSTSRGITLIEGQNRAALVSDQNLMAQQVNTAIGKAVEETLAIPAPSGLDANNIDQEITYVLSGQTVSNLPPDAPTGGVLQTFLLYASSFRPKTQVYITTGSERGIWTRFSGSTGWAAWLRMDGANRLLEGGFLGVAGNLDDARAPGAYGYWSTSMNRPGEASGVVWVSEVHNANTLVQLAVGYNGGLYSRFSGSVGWAAWRRLDAGAVPEVPSIAPPQSSAGFRTVPLALTVGGSAANGPASGIMRMPVRFGARINRWRVHFRNNNPRFGSDGSPVSIAQVFFGPATAGAFTATPTLIASDRTTETVTPWQNTPIEAGVEYAVSYSFSTAGTTNRVVGGGWSASSVSSQSATLTRVVSMPIDAWIEAEIEPDVPVLAVFGDSLSSGVGASLPVYESWMSIYCRNVGALPVHYSASGDTMAGWSDPTHYKWARWQHLSRPDAAFHAMGSNDAFGGATLAEMQSRRATTMQILSDLVTPVIASATILPRSGVSGAKEDTRRAYNTWLKTSPDEARDLYDMVPPISANDEDISPGFDSGDGVHLNASGYTQMQTAITRALVPTTTGWRVLDTSDLSGSIRDPDNPGTFRIRRDGDRVTLRFWGLRLTAGTGTGFILPNGLPVGFQAGGIRVAGQARDLFSTAWTHELTISSNDFFWVCYATHNSRTNVRPTGGGGLEGEITWITDDPMPL